MDPETRKPPSGLEGVPTGELVNRLAAQVSELVRGELELARTELTAKGKRVGAGAGLAGAGGVVALYGLGALIAAGNGALALVWPVWLAALVVGVVVLVVAGVLALAGRSQLRRAARPRRSAPSRACATTSRRCRRRCGDDRRASESEQRADLEGLREELGVTVPELAHRANVPSQVQPGGTTPWPEPGGQRAGEDHRVAEGAASIRHPRRRGRRAAAPRGAPAQASEQVGAKMTEQLVGRARRSRPSPAPSWWAAVRRAFEESSADGVPILAGGVAFFAFLEMFPAIIAALTLYGLVRRRGRPSRPRCATSPAALPGAGPARPPRPARPSRPRAAVRSASAWSSRCWPRSRWPRAAPATSSRPIDVAYDEDESRGYLKVRGIALALTLGAIVFLLLTLALVAVVPVGAQRPAPRARSARSSPSACGGCCSWPSSSPRSP